MSGPAFGKIPLKGKVVVLTNKGEIEIKNCDIYLHLKGYALARVTHIDIECYNEFLESLVEKGEYINYYIVRGVLTIKLRKYKRIDSYVLYGLKVYFEDKEFKEFRNCQGIGYLGKKEGGIYIGFQKHTLRRLEEIGRKRGFKVN